eukprot:12406946-Ditylum_brightwellii.AAC.1
MRKECWEVLKKLWFASQRTCKCMYLTAALEFALKQHLHPAGMNWDQCCKEAMEMVKHVPTGQPPVTCYETIKHDLLILEAMG